MLLAASCGKEIESSVHQNISQPDCVISFVDERVATKSYSENTVTEVRQNGFGIACVTDRNVTVFNEKAEWSSSASAYLTTNGTYYFPAEGRVSFYGVYPFSQSVSISSGVASLSYSQDPSLDLLAVKKTGVSGGSFPVSLSFDHILSLVHFKAIGLDDKSVFNVKSISIDIPESGTFTYDDYTWSCAGTKNESCFSGEKVLSGVTEIPSAVSFVPCAPTVHVSWETYGLDGTTLIAEYSTAKKLDVALAMGEECTITLKLPNKDAQEMMMTVEVKPWTSTEKELKLN